MPQIPIFVALAWLLGFSKFVKKSFVPQTMAFLANCTCDQF
jgi:hypothetical protein